MNVFMIGGTGLLGCEAAKQLIAHGHKVTSVALPPLPEGAPIPKEMEIIFGDINKRSDEEVEEMLKSDLKVTVRCIPLEGGSEGGKCIFTGKSGAGVVKAVFAKSY